MSVTISDTTLTDSRNRTFDLNTVVERSDGSFVVTLKHAILGDLPYQVTESGDEEIWNAITEWKADNADHFDADEEEEEEEGEEEETEEAILEEARTAKLEKLATKFETAADEAYVDSSLGFRADADSDANRNVSGLVTLMAGDEESTVDFCDYDNNMQTLTLAQLQTLQLEIIQNACSLYQQKWGFRDDINAATTTDELKAIKINFTYLSFSE